MSTNGKILIFSLYEKILTALVNDRQIIELNVSSDGKYQIGDIYIGRVDRIAENINAAFVDLGEGYLTFLPLSEMKHIIVTNRELSVNQQIKPSDFVLVQLTKEPIKTKLAGVSGKISLVGKYAVVERCPVGTTPKVLISSKLNKSQHMKFTLDEQIQQMTDVVDEATGIAEKINITIRTNAGSLEDLSLLYDEIEELTKQLMTVYHKAKTRNCYSCLYKRKPDYIEFISNKYDYEYDEIVTDIQEIYDTIRDLLPKHSCRFYEDNQIAMYKLYSMESAVKSLCERKVWLKSGAYLVIEQTEALISIDVNTGKFEKGNTNEETFFKINKEAAEMIAVQLRARNLSGMILVDFINMHKKEHVQELMTYLKTLVKQDPVTTRVVDMTGLGLVEITRKKVNASVEQQLKQECTE